MEIYEINHPATLGILGDSGDSHLFGVLRFHQHRLWALSVFGPDVFKVFMDDHRMEKYWNRLENDGK